MDDPQGFSDENTWLPGSSNNNVSWRQPDIKYARNEIRFFMIERVNATVTSFVLFLSLTSRKGKTVDVSANGILRVQSRLSGNPEIAVTLTGMDNIQGIFLHKIVNRSRFNASKTLEFIPLDGVFDVGHWWIS